MNNTRLEVEYVTDLGKSGEVCALFSPLAASESSGLGGAHLAKYFGEGTAQLLGYTEDRALRPVLLRAARTLLASRQLQLMYCADEPSFFLIKRDAYTQALGFDAALSGREAFRELCERAVKLRLFASLVIEKCPEVSAAEEQPVTRGQRKAAATANVTASQSRSFESIGGVSFRHVDGNTPSAKDTLILQSELYNLGDQELSRRIQSAVTHFNENRPAEALNILKEITQHRSELHDLLYVQALAEARLNLFSDAGKSLLLLLQSNPGHAQAKELLSQLRPYISG